MADYFARALSNLGGGFLSEQDNQKKLQRQSLLDALNGRNIESQIGERDTAAQNTRTLGPLHQRLLGAQADNLESEVDARLHPKPQAPHTVGPGAALVGPDGTPLYQREAVPKAPPKEAAPDRTLVTVQKDDGTVVYVPRDQAVGQQAPQKAAVGSAALKKAVATNRTQLSVIDDALKELGGHPDAVGLKRGVGELVPFMGGVGDVINQRMDPTGVMTRAQIANIGSLLIHDRSGAAVTVSEFQRLTPFIPTIKDNPQAIRDKLAKLKQNIEMETGLLQESVGGGTFSPTGATPSPAGGGKPVSAQDAQHAANDPAFKAWLQKNGYDVSKVP